MIKLNYIEITRLEGRKDQLTSERFSSFKAASRYLYGISTTVGTSDKFTFKAVWEDNQGWAEQLDVARNAKIALADLTIKQVCADLYSTKEEKEKFLNNRIFS